MELRVTRKGIVVPVAVDPRGVTGPTRGQARGPGWRRTSYGMYVPIDTPTDSTEQRIVEAVASASTRTAATGWAALHWQGARWFSGKSATGEEIPVPLAIGDDQHRVRRSGARLCHDWLFADDLMQVDGLPITRPERSVCVAALRARTFEETVQIIDMAAYDDLIDLGSLAAYATRLKGRPHTRRLNSAIGQASENAWSPLEVTMRLRWLTRKPSAVLLCNVPIFDLHGRHLLSPDLFDPETGVAGEYDGLIHDEVRVRRRDLQREDIARAHGIEVVSMLSEDLRDTASFERRLESAYARAASRKGRPTWTLARPEWWVDTSTVASRRALSTEDRHRLLRHRRRESSTG